MLIVRFILVAVEVVTSILLVIIILLLKSKDQGLGLAFGSGMGEALFGSRAGNVLTKITIALTAVFLIDTLLLSITFAAGRQTLMGTAGAPASMPMGTRAPRGAQHAHPSATKPLSSQTAPFTGTPILPGAKFGEGTVAPAQPAAASAPVAPAAEKKP